jgi:hypothetical protein
MNYDKLRLNLLKYGRDTGFAYVSDCFKRHLRLSPKYQQWQRLLNRATIKAMTPNERHILNTLLEMKVLNLVVQHACEPNAALAS